jgi:tetratricopeptide (TPR) repeat protein
MDWLDKLSIVGIVGFALITTGMLGNQEITKRRQHNPGTEAKEEKNSYALQMEIDKKIYQEVTSFEKQGLYTEAMAKLQHIMRRYPEKSLSYIYLAQLYVKQGKLGDGFHNYRRAVEMQPDYADGKTPLFIGDKIKELITEGREKFGREKRLKPKDKEVSKALEDVYYLQSRLAGGCE